jgi:hypothetical protein
MNEALEHLVGLKLPRTTFEKIKFIFKYLSKVCMHFEKDVDKWVTVCYFQKGSESN